MILSTESIPMSEYVNTPMQPWERLLALPLMELEASTVATWRLRGLPSGTLDVPECNVILTSSGDAERFDLAMLKTSTDQCRDVLLMRLAKGMEDDQTAGVTVDAVLRSPAEPILLTNLVPCRLADNALWFVAESNSRCLVVTATGLSVRWRAPAAQCELALGHRRAAAEIGFILKGVEF